MRAQNSLLSFTLLILVLLLAACDGSSGYPVEELAPAAGQEAQEAGASYPGPTLAPPPPTAYPQEADPGPAAEAYPAAETGEDIFPGGAQEAADLGDRLWVLRDFEGPEGASLLPVDALSELNAIEFFPDGRVSIIAGCNVASGIYSAGANEITIRTAGRTANQCPPGSLGPQFEQWLGETAVYSVEGDTLSLILPGGMGALRLQGSGARSYANQFARLFVYAAGLDAPQAQPQALEELLDASLEELVAGEGDLAAAADQAPGAVVLVHAPEGSMARAAGLSDVEQNRPISVLTRMEIGSATKMFTGVLLAQLQEEGLLSLDDPLAQWLPALAEAIPHGERMTLRQLATHTSGIPDYAPLVIGAGVSDSEARRSAYTPEELVRLAVENSPPDFEPGAPGRWRYSSTGYILLGMVLEAASGQSYQELLQQRIFDPLGMRDTLLLTGVPEPGLVSEGYFHFPFDNDTTEWNGTQGWAASGIASTAADMARFARGLMGGALFRDPATLKVMADFAGAGDYPELAAAGGSGYGIGLMEFAPGLYGHRGQTLGFTSIVAMDPARDFILIALTNAAGTAGHGDQELMGYYLPMQE